MRLNEIIGLFTFVLPSIVRQPSRASGTLTKCLPLQAEAGQCICELLSGLAITDKCGFDLVTSSLTLALYICGTRAKGAVLHTGKSSIHPYSGQGGAIVVGSQGVRKVCLTPEIAGPEKERKASEV